MEPQNYIVAKIEGDYATLKNTETSDEVFIALALLPQGVDVGTKLVCEYFEYRVV